MRPVFIGCTVLLVCLCACAPGSQASHHAADGGFIAQLVLGLWHGVIAPVTLIVEIINKLLPRLLPWKMHLFERDGTGLAYDIGFFLGLAGGPPIFIRGWRRRR
jgi:hypothetical protein